MKFIFGLCLLLALAGCMQSLRGDSYSREETGRIQQVEYATIVALRPVVIEGSKTPIGTLVGGALGAIGGSAIGAGKGRAAATVAGAAAGAAVGSLGEEAWTRAQGEEITLRRDDGTRISLVQERSPDMPLRVGDRVRILRGDDGRVRVSR